MTTTLWVPDAFRGELEGFGAWLAIEPLAGDADAERVAARLEDVVMSSDIDCPYFPCVLQAEDPLSDAFFAALGISRDARQDVGGYDNPKLEVTSADDRSPMGLLTRLGDHELGRMDEYLTKSDQEALTAAIADLGSVGKVVGVQLCADDGATKLVLTLATRPGGPAVGLAVLRSET